MSGGQKREIGSTALLDLRWFTTTKHTDYDRKRENIHQIDGPDAATVWISTHNTIRGMRHRS